jgi:hypothetical protein
MKKILIIIVIVVLLITAGVFYSLYGKSLKTNDAEKEGEKISEQKSEKEVKGIELEGKVVGLSGTQIAIGKPEGGLELLNISVSTPVFEKDNKTKSGMGFVQLQKTVKVIYDESTKDALSITLTDK